MFLIKTDRFHILLFYAEFNMVIKKIRMAFRKPDFLSDVAERLIWYDMLKEFEIVYVGRAAYEYIRSNKFLPMIADRTFTNEQFNAIRCIRNCRTAEMGAHMSECESCHATFIHYNSCKNRHCPMCQGMDVDEWIDLRREDVLDAPYFHTVFSIPSQLYPLVYANQKLMNLILRKAFSRRLVLCWTKVGKPT